MLRLPLTVVFLCLTLGGTSASAQSGKSVDPLAEVKKGARVEVWQPGPDGEQIALWPRSVKLDKPDTGDHPEEVGHGTGPVAGKPWQWASYVTRPTMTIYRPKEENTRSAMLVLPGGGFAAVAMDLEGTEICDWAVRLGMTCAVLKYRVPQAWTDGKRPDKLLALEDAQRAMGMLRERAADYDIDPERIGVIGFSAGAYLAANMSNAPTRDYPPVDAADKQSPVPDFAIIAYTARIRDNSKAPTDLSLAPWVKISPDAPPTLIIHAMNDPMDDVRHPMAYALALKEAGVPVDMRIYSRGGHAFGLRPTDAPVTTEWPGEAKQWLTDIGMLPR